MMKLKQTGWAHGVRCILLWCPLILSIGSVIKIAYRRHLARMAVAPESQYFRRIYAVVSANFADPVAPETAIYHGAIPGMLRVLDPHSTFFDQQEFRKHIEAVHGHHSGVGIELAYQNCQFIVVGSHTNSPSQRAGIRSGDLIVAINGKPADTMKLSEVRDVLTSPEGTTTQISIERDDHKLNFNLKAAVISRKSVLGVTWIRPRIAYLAILVFNESTPLELEENLKKCQQKGMEGLILDLRDNPGGTMRSAVAVGDQFLHLGE